MRWNQSPAHIPCHHCSEGFHPIGTIFCPNTGKPLKSNFLKIVSASLAAVILITGTWFLVEHFRKTPVADFHPEPTPTVTEYQTMTLQTPFKDNFHRELARTTLEPETTSTTLEPAQTEPEPEPIPKVQPKPVISLTAPFSIHEDRYQTLFNSLIKGGIKPERIVEIFSSARAKKVDMTPVEKMSEKVIVPISERTAKESRLIAGKIKKHLENYKTDYDNLERKFRVNREVVAAILFKETSLGAYLGNYESFTVLNSILSFMELPDIADIRKKARTERIISTSQRSLEGLLRYCDKYQIDITTKEFPSSFSGAVGICQFLPMYMDYAITSGNSIPDLYKMSDAILSLGNILKNRFDYSGFIDFDKLRNIDEIIDKYQEYDKQKDVSFCMAVHLDGYPLRRFVDDFSDIPDIDYIGKIAVCLMNYNFSSFYALDILQLAFYSHKVANPR